jgi:hypothetical protein
MMATSNNNPVSDDYHRLILVVKDLAHQLDENRQATAKLKLHADLLKVSSYAFHDFNRYSGTNAVLQVFRFCSFWTFNRIQ